MQFDTKIAVILRDDLPTWQKLNVTAFTMSGIAGTTPLAMRALSILSGMLVLFLAYAVGTQVGGRQILICALELTDRRSGGADNHDILVVHGRPLTTDRTD